MHKVTYNEHSHGLRPTPCPALDHPSAIQRVANSNHNAKSQQQSAANCDPFFDINASEGLGHK